MRRILLRAGGTALVLAAILGLNVVYGNLLNSVQDMLILCGISVIMAVSLNIVNGLTGQFAIGHAGFMAVGAYTGASVTYLALAHFTHSGDQANLLWMLLAMLAGGALAAVFG